MNINQMHIGVNLEVQKIASNANDNLLSQEVDYYLNEAIEDFIREQYSSIKTEERNLQSQYINENLRTLITTEDIINVSPVDYIPNTIKGELPSDYRFYLFARTKRNGNWINNRKIETKAIKKYLETETNKPVFREFPLVIENDTIMVTGDTRGSLNEFSEIKFTYIRNPAIVEFPTTDSDLPDHTHKQIVKIASQKILRALNVGVQ